MTPLSFYPYSLLHRGKLPPYSSFENTKTNNHTSTDKMVLPVAKESLLKETYSPLTYGPQPGDRCWSRAVCPPPLSFIHLILQSKYEY